MKRIIKILLLICWIGVIFSLSFQKSDETTKTSFGVTKSIASIYLNITNNYSEDNLNKLVEEIHPMIRKVAHFSEFFILAILTMVVLNDFKFKYKYLYTIIFCLVIASFDESIQYFVDGRVSSLKDVLIDTSGSIVYTLLNYIYKKVK